MRLLRKRRREEKLAGLSGDNLPPKPKPQKRPKAEISFVWPDSQPSPSVSSGRPGSEPPEELIEEIDNPSPSKREESPEISLPPPEEEEILEVPPTEDPEESEDVAYEVDTDPDEQLNNLLNVISHTIRTSGSPGHQVTVARECLKFLRVSQCEEDDLNFI